MPCRESPAIREEMKRDLKTELYVILSVHDNRLFRVPSSVSGTGRDCRVNRARLPGDLPARPWFSNEHTLWSRGA